MRTSLSSVPVHCEDTHTHSTHTRTHTYMSTVYNIHTHIYIYTHIHLQYTVTYSLPPAPTLGHMQHHPPLCLHLIGRWMFHPILLDPLEHLRVKCENEDTWNSHMASCTPQAHTRGDLCYVTVTSQLCLSGSGLTCACVPTAYVYHREGIYSMLLVTFCYIYTVQ